MNIQEIFFNKKNINKNINNNNNIKNGLICLSKRKIFNNDFKEKERNKRIY